MADFSQASLYFTIGVPTEDANILANTGDVTVVALEDAVAELYPDRTFEDGGRDPHIWLSPKRVAVMIDTICAEMSQLDPDNVSTYQANAQNYKDQLQEVDAEITAALSGVTNKTFIAYHPAFGYLADDYGLTMVALEEEGKEATPQQLQAAIDLAKAQNIKVIFYQEEIDSSQSQAFAEELGGQTIQLEPLSADYINNMRKMAQTMAEAME
jgi:zinc transport system substrate-binding protein